MNATKPDTLSRYKGCLLGLAVGDALGTTLEFKSPGTFQPIDGMIGGGPFNLKPGEWTDDTSLALCLAESLIEKKKFDPQDQLVRYCEAPPKPYWKLVGRLAPYQTLDVVVTGAKWIAMSHVSGNMSRLFAPCKPSDLAAHP